jgi:hypothetical protein
MYTTLRIGLPSDRDYRFLSAAHPSSALVPYESASSLLAWHLKYPSSALEPRDHGAVLYEVG